MHAPQERWMAVESAHQCWAVYLWWGSASSVGAPEPSRCSRGAPWSSAQLSKHQRHFPPCHFASFHLQIQRRLRSLTPELRPVHRWPGMESIARISSLLESGAYLRHRHRHRRRRQRSVSVSSASVLSMLTTSWYSSRAHPRCRLGDAQRPQHRSPSRPYTDQEAAGQSK